MLSLHARCRSWFLFCRSAIAALMVVTLCTGGARKALAQILPGGALTGKIYLSDLRYLPMNANPIRVQLSWDNEDVDLTTPSSDPDSDLGAPITIGGGTVWTTLNRVPDFAISGGITTTGLPTAVETGGDQYIQTYQDDSCALNTRYRYYLTGYVFHWEWVSGDGDTDGYWNCVHVDATGDSTYVTVEKKAVSANQTVDTRIDPRFDLPPLVNFPFANTQFRGGLFTGYNGDSAQVARTYLKFTSLPGPLSSGETLWPVGGMMAYATRLAKTGTASVRCLSATSSSWDPATLTWDTAPALTSEVGSAASIAWNKTNPLEQWVQFAALSDITAALSGGTSNLTLVLQASDESGSGTATTAGAGWAYFARNTYAEPAAPASYTPPTTPLPPTSFYPGGGHGQDLSAFLLYAFGGSVPDAVHCIQFAPNPIYGEGYSEGSVTLLTGELSHDLVLSLSSDDPALSVPATVTIPAYSTSATFDVSTMGTGLPFPTTVTVRATNGDYHLSGTVILAPPDDDGGDGG